MKTAESKHVWLDREPKNLKLRKLLDDAGYQDVHLVKGDGYFYFVSHGESKIADVVDAMSDTSIYVNSFLHQTPKQWFEDIDRMIKAALEKY